MKHKDTLLLPDDIYEQLDAGVFEAFNIAHLENQATYSQMTVAGERKTRLYEQLRIGKDIDETARGLDADALSDRIDSLKQWKKGLLADEAIDPAIKQLYRWRVNEDIANIHLLDASRRGDMGEFMRWNEFIYGKPDEQIYRAALDWVARDAEVLALDPEQHVSTVRAAEGVLTMLSDERGYHELLAPEEVTFEAVKRDHGRAGGYYALLLAGIELPEGKVSKEIGDSLLRHVISNNLGSSYGVADAESATWSVNHATESIERPASYSLPTKRFQGLALGHEIGSHLLEQANGMRGPLQLLSSGLDRYELGNEGRATIREQVPYETFDEFGKLVRWRDILRRHIAVSYTYGVGVDVPRKSRELYAFMNTIDTMYQMKLNPDNPEVVAQKAHDKTAQLVTRVLRGVDGAQGGVFLKDKVYLEGHVASWASAHARGAQVVSGGDFGKMDINNFRHIAAVEYIKEAGLRENGSLSDSST